MTTYVRDSDDNVVSEECLYYCSPVFVAECNGKLCRCGCHTDDAETAAAELAERARALDARPDTAIAAIARDMDKERFGDVTTDRLSTLDEVRAERYWPKRGAA